MRATLALIAFVAALPLAAQQAPPSELMDAATLRATGDALVQQAKTRSDGVAFKILLTRPDGNEQVTVRVKSGQGEWHRDYVDVMIGLEGHAQVRTGGTVVHGKESMPGEIRGDSVAGGTLQPFGPGDVLRVEPRVAHQFLLAPGTTVKYVAIKIKVTE